MTAIARFLIVCAIIAFGWPSAGDRAEAAPAGVRGWCTVAGVAGQYTCLGSPQEACQLQHDVYSPTSIFYGIEDDPQYWWAKNCKWSLVFAESRPGNVIFLCEYPHVEVAPGSCIQRYENIPYRGLAADSSCGLGGANQKGNIIGSTGRPIDILSGAKLFRIEDFRTADGSLVLERLFNSKNFIGTRNLLRNPVGLGQYWRFSFQHELHLDLTYGLGPRVRIATAEGGAFLFQRNSSTGVFVPVAPDFGLQKQSDYTLEFVGTWPASVSSGGSQSVAHDGSRGPCVGL